MKRYITSAQDNERIKLNFNVEVVFGIIEQSAENIAASLDSVPDKVPKSKLPHVVKNVPLGPQAQADFDAFIECVEELMEDYYDLHVYYRHRSKYHSRYYTCAAKDKNGMLIVDFKVKIRIATHEAHESSQADYNKKKEKEAELNLTKGVKLKPLLIKLQCNDENEDVETYDQAYLWIDKRIEEKVSIMRSQEAYRKKINIPEF